MNEKAEEIRIRYLYRDLVLRKQVRLPLEAAVKIIGPDCAYHLYSDLSYTKEKRGKGQPKPGSKKA